MDIFTTFSQNGKFLNKDFAYLEWHEHPSFEGVELKHLITAADSGGLFSYHLVRIAPGKVISNHIHETQLETHEVISGTGRCLNDGRETLYTPGVISLFPAGIKHEVHANSAGLCLFAKFIPALC